MNAPVSKNANVSDFVTFDDRSLASSWSGKKVPFSDVYEAYIDGRIDIPAEKWDEFFDTRHDTMTFRLTEGHVKWAVTNFLPEVALHSKSQDSRIVSEHYNRGNDFFEWCLGPAMVYTAAYHDKLNAPLEESQYRKIDRVCDKLKLGAGEKLLDIGCGWGTFVARSARERGANTYGVTLAQEQVNFGMARIKDYGVLDRAKVEVCDYRNISGKFDKIVSLEMVEHVGIKNLKTYYKKVHSLLKDDGLFLLSWTGIRGLKNPQNPLSALTMRPEDLIWGLFMSRYIFPGADASLTLGGMIEAAEDSGFEVDDVENLSPHYVQTLRAWRDIWVSNREAVVKTYGERWFRLWYFFLHWSAIIGERGCAFNYHLLMHKNDETFDRLGLRYSGLPYCRS